jgi:tagatose-6-phosphate ketose/aldose isomerase
MTANPDLYVKGDRPSLMIHFARSGNSPESRAVLEAGLQRMGDQGRHLVITCNEDGTLADIARAHPDRVCLVVLPEASHDQGLAMTSSYSSMVVAAQALAHLDRMAAFREQVDRTAQAGEYVLHTYPDRIRERVGRDISRAFFLGNNDLFGAATESALKVQELTAGQILAQGGDALSFRHGPISAVDERSLVCFYLSERSYTRRYELDVVRQYQDAFRDIGAETVVVTSEPPEEELGEGVTVMSYDPDRQWTVSALQQVTVAVLFGQLAGLFAAHRRGVNVDEPSAEKALYNRTVQGVRLYDPSEVF